MRCRFSHAHPASPAKRRRKASDQIFAEPSGARYTKHKQRLDLHKAVAACQEIADHKKPKITMHVMRHTAASLMVASGIPINDVAQILGHENIQITMRYAHFAPEAGRAAVEALDKVLDLNVDADRVAERIEGLASRIG